MGVEEEDRKHTWMEDAESVSRLETEGGGARRIVDTWMEDVKSEQIGSFGGRG